MTNATTLTKTGTALLGMHDYNAWRSSQVTLAELAARCRVSVAAVSKFFKKLAKEQTETPAVTLSLPSDPDAKPIPLVTAYEWMQQDKPLPSYTEEHALIVAKSAAFSAMLHVNEDLVAHTKLAPSIVKAAMSGLGDAIEALVKLGAINLNEIEGQQLTKLRIEVMSEEEERILRAGGTLDDLKAKDEADVDGDAS